MSRGLSVFSSIVIILGVISTMITLLVNEIISGFTYLSNVVPEKFNQFTIFIYNFYSIKIIPIFNILIIIFEDLKQYQIIYIFDLLNILCHIILIFIMNYKKKSINIQFLLKIFIVKKLIQFIIIY